MEKWKTYPLEFEFEEDYKIEISNYGRVKTYNVLQPDGAIVNCSREQGYPILKKTFHKKRTESDAQKLEELDYEISIHQEKIKETKKNLEISLQERKILLVDLRKERDLLVKKRKNLNHKINKKRAIYFSLLIHKAVAELFLEKPSPEHQFVIHKDYKKDNNMVSNLEWATKKQTYDRYAHNPYYKVKKFEDNLYGRKTVRVKTSKLSVNDVLYIKNKLMKGDITSKKLAEQFGVSDMQIYRIKTGENWGHIKTVSELKSEKRA